MRRLSNIGRAITEFSREERRAILVVVAVIAVIATLRYALHRPLVTRNGDLFVDTLLLNKPAMKPRDTLFRFDPNHVTDKQLIQLGFSRRQVEVIERYRKSGVRFYTPEDFGRCYAVSDRMLQKLTPYLIFPPKPTGAKQVNNKVLQHSPLNFNTIDSLALIKIRGIGNVLSHRILAYRRRLGGYVDFSQLREVYGVSDSLISALREKFFINHSDITKIDINFAVAKNLENHPYLNRTAVHRVLKQRQLKGGWNNITQMKNDDILLPREASKLEPYLEFRPVSRCDADTLK